MSLEQKIEELTGTISALVAVMERTAANQERLLAGQEKAIEAVKAGNPTTATRGRKAKEATPTPNEEPADTASGAGDAKTASEPAEEKKADPEPAPAAEKATFGVAAKKWMDKEEKGTDAYKARGAKVVGILAHFGAGKMSELKDEDDAKAMFFLKRTAKGLPVNFEAAYDFDGPADQEEPVAAEVASDDDDDMFD